MVGKKDGILHIIESKNGQNPRFTKFQKMAFPKINGKANRFKEWVDNQE